ncbi:hypothetical protein ACFQ2Y_48065 [Streptomyces malaysiensis subsp. malaysiensis]
MQWGIEPQHLLHHGLGRPRPVGDPPPQPGVAEQKQHTVGDQVDGCLVTGHEQQRADGGHFLGIGRALVGQGDELRDDIAARSRAAGGNQLVEVVQYRGAGTGPLRAGRGVEVERLVHVPCHRPRPAAQPGKVLLRQTEEFADDAHGQRKREVGDDIHELPLTGGIEQLGHNPLDTLRQPGEGGNQTGVGQPAQPRVRAGPAA